MRKLRKAVVTLAITAATVTGYLQTNAFAANTGDTQYTLQFPKFQGLPYATTEDRTKYDYSSVWNDCRWVGDEGKDDYKYEGRVITWDGRECSTDSQRITFTDKTARYMPSFAYEWYGKENGNNEVSVRIKGVMGYNFVYVHASGYWSPDSY